MEVAAAVSPTTAVPRASGGVWRLPWLTPAVCRVIFAGLLLFGLVSHVRYLTHDCPIDLSGDEAQYWDWSRALDWSYYSKGPLIAYIIRASCAAFGDVMWAVRLPAVLFAVATSILTYWITLRLFKSDALALGRRADRHDVFDPADRVECETRLGDVPARRETDRRGHAGPLAQRELF